MEGAKFGQTPQFERLVAKAWKGDGRTLRIQGTFEEHECAQILAQ